MNVLAHLAAPPHPITIEPLTPEGFKEFGGVFDADHLLAARNAEGTNQGTANKVPCAIPEETPCLEIGANGKGAKVVNLPPSGIFPKLNLNLFRCTPNTSVLSPDGKKFLGFTGKYMERHPYTTQTFAPIGRNKDEYTFICMGAPTGPDGLPDLTKLRGFLGKGNQAVTYGVKTWHAPMCGIGNYTDFLVIVHETGVLEEDLEMVEIEAPHIQFVPPK